MASPTSRYAAAARRALRSRTAIAGAVLVLPGLACGASDEDVFGGVTTASTTVATPGPAATTTELASPSTTVVDATAPTTGASTTGASVAGGTFPAGAELVVDFTYEAISGGGRVENPYIAVWVEDPDGNLVATVSVWFNPSSKGLLYLHELRRWYSVSDGGADLTMSGATRVGGTYSVSWDGSDDAGQPVEQGDYVIVIEAAREHGPYEVISSPVIIGTEGFHVDLVGDGELVAASVELQV
jgi:hypothetical protein